MATVLGALIRPGIDWVKRVVLSIAFRELAEEVSTAAGYAVEPPPLGEVPALPAPSRKGRQ